MGTTSSEVKKMKMSPDEWVAVKSAPEQILQYPSFVSNAVVYIRAQLTVLEQKLKAYVRKATEEKSSPFKNKEKFDIQNMCSLVQLTQTQPQTVGNTVTFEEQPVSLVSVLDDEAVIELPSASAQSSRSLRRALTAFEDNERLTVPLSALSGFGPAQELKIKFANDAYVVAVS